MSGIVQRFERNLHGRDFVVGDIHGCFDALRRALGRVQFVPDSDRLFSVGDLIDRGPRSTEALDWLNRPWFHACIGNHEDMALQSQHDDNILGGWLLFNGGDWWLTQDNETRSHYLEAFRQLPVAMQVETARGRIGIVHADVPRELSWQDFLKALEGGDNEARNTAIWSRQRAEGRLRELGYQWEWLPDGCLKATTPPLPAIVQMADGRSVFFNQLIAAFRGWKDERNDPSKAIRHGDGSPLDAEAVGVAVELAEELAFDLAWQVGDVVIVDNMVAMHARRPFVGTRKVFASLAQMETNVFEPVAT